MVHLFFISRGFSCGGGRAVLLHQVLRVQRMRRSPELPGLRLQLRLRRYIDLDTGCLDGVLVKLPVSRVNFDGPDVVSSLTCNNLGGYRDTIGD